MKHQYTAHCIVLVFLAAILSACNTFDTLNPQAEDNHGKPLDETKGTYGQPYFLPKGFIHLTIKSSAGGAGQSQSTPSTAFSSVVNNFNVNQAATPAPGHNSGSQDSKTKVITYKISAERSLVADHSAGQYFAHYNPNWLYSDTVGIGVTNDGLLTTFTSDLSDRTGQTL